MRCVKPSRATKLPSLTSDATASGSGWICPAFFTPETSELVRPAHICAQQEHYRSGVWRERALVRVRTGSRGRGDVGRRVAWRVGGAPLEALDGERHALPDADAQGGQSATGALVLQAAQEVDDEP